MNDVHRKIKLIFLMLALVIITVFVSIRNMVLQKMTDLHQQQAQAVGAVFTEKIKENFNYLNYASLVAIGLTDSKDSYNFTEISERLLEQHDEIAYLALFSGDFVEKVLPAEYEMLEGRNLSYFPYSHTLAKVIKNSVVEGPVALEFYEENVFLFICPIVNQNEFKGEVVAALKQDSVMERLGLDLLETGGYDYELWRVNELGEHKNVIAVSDESIDFSDAVKMEFNLPAKWNISILPKEKWVSSTTKLFIDISFLMGGIVVFSLIWALYMLCQRNKKLKRERYTDPDSGLLNLDGFCSFVNEKLNSDNPGFQLLYIRLTNFHELSIKIQHTLVKEYLSQVFKSIKNNFPDDTLAARMHDEILIIGLFQEEDRNKIEEFMLQLIWKTRINGKKEFINPEYCMVRVPDDGMNAGALIEAAEKKYQVQMNQIPS